jgi:hypothetical protein
MYCPNCTTEISTDHHYCRSCGVDLQEISLALGGRRHIDRSAGFDEKQPERVVSKSTRVWGRGFYCGILGVALVFLHSWLLPGVRLPILGGVGLVLMLAAVCLMLSSYFVRDQSPKTRQSPTGTKKLPAEEFAVKFPAPSVTERTTNLFEESGREGSRPDRVSH